MQTDSTTYARLVLYAPAAALGSLATGGDGRVLGVVAYGCGDATDRPGGAGLPELHSDLRIDLYVDLPALLPARPCAELWLADAVRGAAAFGPVRCAWGDELLFGAVSARVPDRPALRRGGIRIDPGLPLERAARGAYDAVFAAARAAGFPHLLRVWNYFPDINRAAGEPGRMERYRQFNIGRAEGFTAAGVSAGEGSPAASALGSRHGDLVLYFLAVRDPPLAIENPRQVSAYRYPPQYGPRSPGFSRAMVARIGGEPRLLISGTASIVGHETVHAGDVAAQTSESLANLDAVVREANRQLGTAQFALRDMALKVYLRHAADLPRAQRVVAGALGAGADAIYLQADVCRADLLVEIEACC